MNILLKFIGLASLLVAAASAAGCSNREKNSPGTGETETAEAAPENTPDELPAELLALSRDMAEGNVGAFAHACSYPVERPYPLRDIKDSVAMTEYFPVMVDDSLRHVMRRAGKHRWHRAGWRGWTLDNGEYVWWDGNLYAVNYVSDAERKLHDRLAREEIESLPEELRDGWQPYFCLIGMDNGTIYRIDEAAPADSLDCLATDDGGEDFRMLVYPKDRNLHNSPSDLFKGRMDVEGSAGSRCLYFSNSRGDRAEFAMDIADDSVPVLLIVSRGDSTQQRVERVYWRDYLLIKR